MSGIVLFARTSKALSRLNAQMRARQIQKTYTAKVEGHFKEKKGELRNLLAHDSHRAAVKKIAAPTSTTPQALGCDRYEEAILSYAVKKEDAKGSLLLVQLHTGRYHQIRAQLSYIGHPILGDTKYGATQKYPRLALHHSQLIFYHPITNKTITIQSNINFN